MALSMPDKSISISALFVNAVYGSFASLRVTRIRFVVILSTAKDPYAMFIEHIVFIPQLSVMSKK